jgi:flagellar biosynthesis/type III secretory pathway protein FliH
MSWSSARPGVRRLAGAAGHAAAWAPAELEYPAPDSVDAFPRPDADLAPASAEAREAAMRVAEAEARAERALAALARAEREAFERGRAAGHAEAEAAMRDRLEGAVAAAEAAAAQIRAAEQRWLGALEENVCAVGVAVARHLIGRELRADPATVAELVRRALQEFPVDQHLRIRIHPADLALLSTAVGPDGAPIPIAGGRDVRWLADERLHPGGCMVEGRDRIIDGRVDTALERAYRRLTSTNA